MKKTTRIKEVMKNPQALAIMDKYIEGFGKDSRLKMAGMMTVEQLVAYVPNFSEEQKQSLYAELAGIVEEV